MAQAQYLLLTPINPIEDMGLTIEEFKEALEEYACDFIESLDTDDKTSYFITSKTVAALNKLVSEVAINGIMVEYTGVYDQYQKAI